MKEIKCTTIYNEKNTKKFLNIYFFDKIKYVRWIVNICIIIIIINFLRSPEINAKNIIAFLFSLLGILELNTSFLPNFNYKKLVNKKDTILNTEINYTFKERNVKIATNKSEYIDYKDLTKIIEVTDAFYLYINNSKAFIVSKENLKDEEIKTLTDTLKKEVKKYKVIKK